MPTLPENFRTVCQALYALQGAIVDENTEVGPLSPRLDRALKASWAQWSPSDDDPTVNTKAPAEAEVPYVLPTIHLNGSSPARLRDDYTAARNAVEDALRKIAAIGLNGRDYYPQGNQAYQKAQLQMTSQLERLTSVRTELERLEMHCYSFVK